MSTCSLHRLTSDNVVKISCSTGSRDIFFEDYADWNRSCSLPLRWLSLESLLQGKYTHASDVVRFRRVCLNLRNSVCLELLGTILENFGIFAFSASTSFGRVDDADSYRGLTHWAPPVAYTAPPWSIGRNLKFLYSHFKLHMAGKEACKKRPQLLYKVVQVSKKGKKMYLNCVRFHCYGIHWWHAPKTQYTWNYFSFHYFDRV